MSDSEVSSADSADRASAADDALSANTASVEAASAGSTPGAAEQADPAPRRRPWIRVRFAALSRRGKVLAVGGLTTAALLALATAIPVPYVALGPGSTFNTTGAAQGREVISFTGDDIPAAASEVPSGHLNMLTIRVIDRVPLIEAAAMWASGTFAFAPRDEYYPPDRTKEEITEQNVQMFRDSQSAAEIAALRYLQYPNIVYVGTIAEGSASWGKLRPDDRITAVDGHSVSDYLSLKAVMTDTQPGQQVTVDVLRDGKSASAQVTLGANATVGPQGFLGVGVAERPQAPFTIDISLQDIGGPSAGLMFTLGIIDRLTPGDLTGGRFIAGTGTMELDSTVGPIGGITFKEVTAREAGAEFMLVPAANCAEAVTAVPDGLTLVKVSTLDDAMAAVKMIAAGGTPPGC